MKYSFDCFDPKKQAAISMQQNHGKRPRGENCTYINFLNMIRVQANGLALTTEIGTLDT